MSNQAKPSIVFAHGLWADGSCFSKLIPTLQAEGHEVMASQHGLNSLATDVAAVKACLARVSSPAILVGHSYGGTLITHAGTDPRVTGLVYIAALAPDADETSQSQQDKFPVTDVFQHIEVTDGRIGSNRAGSTASRETCLRRSRSSCTHTGGAGAGPVHAKGRRHGVEDQAQLVHRRKPGPHRSPRTGTLRGEAHGGNHHRGGQQPCSHALQPSLVLDVIRKAASTVPSP